MLALFLYGLSGLHKDTLLFLAHMIGALKLTFAINGMSYIQTKFAVLTLDTEICPYLLVSRKTEFQLALFYLLIRKKKIQNWGQQKQV